MRQCDLSLTPEGVEMLDQGTLLQGMGCNRGQGYLFGKPMQPAELEETFKLGEQRRETAPLIERTRHA